MASVAAARRAISILSRHDKMPKQSSWQTARRSFSMQQLSSMDRLGRPCGATSPRQTVSRSARVISPSVYARGRRRFTTTPTPQHEHLTPPKPGEELKVTFVTKEGDSHTFEVAAGDNLLNIAIDNDLEMEGACGGSCACSTCHVIVDDPNVYDKLAEPTDEENDMLDLAFGLTETSRLGCQVEMTKELDGLVVRLPSMTRNLQKSDFDSK